MIIAESCRHIVNTIYGKLSDHAQQREIARLNKTSDKLIKASELAKRNLFNHNKEKFAAGNVSGIAATRNQ